MGYMFPPKAWTLIYSLLLWYIVMCAPSFRIRNTERREVTVFFNDEGNLMEFSSVPKCESGGKISLSEYIYRQMECLSASADDCTSVRNDKLLPEEELLLHKECSLRNVCTTLRYPMRLTRLENKINAMTIKFQCIDRNSTFFDICEKRKLYFNHTLHLTQSGSTHFTDCRCWVNNGKFNMILNDIRLTQENGSECSTAQLVINNNLLSCDGKKEEGFGSIFHDKIEDIPPLGAYVSLFSKSQNLSVDMVWLIIHPKETSRIDCGGDFTSQNHGPEMTTPTPNLVQSALTLTPTVSSSTQTNAEQPETSQSESEGKYASQKHAPDTTPPTQNVVRSTLTPRSAITSSTQINAEIPDTSIGESMKSYIDPVSIINAVMLVVVIVCLIFLIVKMLKRSRMTSKPQDSRNATENVEITSFTLDNKEDLTHQIRTRTTEEDKQTLGQLQNGVNSVTLLQHLQQLGNTNLHTSSDSIPLRKHRVLSLPNFQNIDPSKVIPLDELRQQTNQQQKIAVRQYNREVTETEQNPTFQMNSRVKNALQVLFAALTDGHNRQLSEMRISPVVECNTERNTPFGSRHFLSNVSSNSEDEMRCAKNYADLTHSSLLHIDVLPDSETNDINTELLKSGPKLETATANNADSSGLLDCMADQLVTQVQTPFTEARQASDFDGDESTSLLTHQSLIDLRTKADRVKKYVPSLRTELLNEVNKVYSLH